MMKYLLAILSVLLSFSSPAQENKGESLECRTKKILDSLQHNLPEYKEMVEKVSQNHKACICMQYAYPYTDNYVFTDQPDTTGIWMGSIVNYEFGFKKYRKWVHWRHHLHHDHDAHILLHVGYSMSENKVLYLTKSRKEVKKILSDLSKRGYR